MNYCYGLACRSLKNDSSAWQVTKGEAAWFNSHYAQVRFYFVSGRSFAAFMQIPCPLAGAHSNCRIAIDQEG